MEKSWGIIQLGNDIKSKVTQVLTINAEIYKVIVATQKRIPPSLSYQQPVTFQDALGRISPVHLEFVNSWAAFDAIVTARFSDMPGQSKVAKREWVLQDHTTKRELKRSLPWESLILPGQRIEMSIIFNSPHSGSTSCPGCGAKVEGSCASEMQWYGASIPRNT